MNKKQLAVFLSKLEGFISSDAKLEQYATDSEIAADILWRAFLGGDIKGKRVVDLGCGNGVLGIGALKLGAKKVYFVEKDKKVLEVLKRNLGGFKDYEIFIGDVSGFSESVDVVIENPPFGVQVRKADEKFLLKATEVSKKIYSFHKIESSKFIETICSLNGFKVVGVVEYDFLLWKTMKFHKKRKYYVKVGCWVLEKKKKRNF